MTTEPKPVDQLTIQIFSDGAGEAEMLSLAQKPYIKGFTTNPTLMREANVEDYAAFATDVAGKISGKSISFEVFSDDFEDMERQARLIHTWGPNVFVKIPISNTQGASTVPLIARLTQDGINVNVTAIMAPEQIREATEALSPNAHSYISFFAGRVADVGVDPMPITREAAALLADKPHIELLWASCREVYNIYEAEEAGAEIITVPPSILKKLDGIGTPLSALSLAAVRRFYEDGNAAGYTL